MKHPYRFRSRTFAVLSVFLAFLLLAGCAGTAQPPAATQTPTPSLDSISSPPVTSAEPLAASNPDMNAVKLCPDNACTSVELPFGSNAGIPDPEGVEIITETLQNAFAFPDKLLLQSRISFRTPLDGMQAIWSGMRIYESDLDGGNIHLAAEYLPDIQVSETRRSSSGMDCCLPLEDGSCWFCRTESTQDWSDIMAPVDEKKTFLIHTSADGSEISSYDISEPLMNPAYPVQSLLLADSGEIVVYNYLRILFISPDGEMKQSIDPGMVHGGPVKTGCGDLVFWSMDLTTGGRRLLRVSAASGETEDLGSVPSVVSGDLIGGEGSTLLIGTSFGYDCFDYVTGQRYEVLNWLESGLIGNLMVQTISLPDGRFIVTETNGQAEPVATLLLSPLPAEELFEKTVIWLGATQADLRLQQAIIDFNRQNTALHIRMAAYDMQTLKLLPGASETIPADRKADILVLLTAEQAAEYGNAGLLLDLKSRMTADPSFDTAQYLENVLFAASTQGKCYGVIPSFVLETMAGKSELVGSDMGWTAKELCDLMAQYPESEMLDMADKTLLLYHFRMHALGHFANAETGECRFDTEEFRSLLELMKEFPDTFDSVSFYSSPDSPFFTVDYAQRYLNGSVLLSSASLSGYESYRRILGDFGGAVTLIGFPVPEGVGETIIPSSLLGICADSPCVDFCYDFLKFALSEPYQSCTASSFPVLRSALDTLAAEAMTVQDGGLSLTQKDIDAVNAALEAAECVNQNRMQVMSIVEEEAHRYFSDEITAMEAAENIQKRVEGFFAENG